MTILDDVKRASEWKSKSRRPDLRPKSSAIEKVFIPSNMHEKTSKGRADSSTLARHEIFSFTLRNPSLSCCSSYRRSVRIMPKSPVWWVGAVAPEICTWKFTLHTSWMRHKNTEEKTAKAHERSGTNFSRVDVDSFLQWLLSCQPDRMFICWAPEQIVTRVESSNERDENKILIQFGGNK